jgi:hypothetical protein
MDKRYLSNYLFLLVGGNPLPNAIAGKILVTPGGKVILVHSPDTANVAQRLRAWLNKQGIASVDLADVEEEANSASIFRCVRRHVASEKSQSIGLNYTGGTKAMSVHAYRAMEQWAKENGATPAFSYLDARNLRMVFDPPDPMSGAHGHSEYVGRAMELKLEDMLELHGWTLKHPPTTQPALPMTANELAVACNGDNAFSDWKQWVHGELRAKCRRPDRDDEWKNKTALRSISLDLPKSETLAQVVQTLQSELGLPEGHLALVQSALGNDAKHLCEWLDGKWLEHYVLGALRKEAAPLKLHYCAQNVEAHEVQFDVDVVALRGYQLFAFSCSTDSRKWLLKSKLFEAYIRARQLGGDEARVALVCCSNEPERLEHEMRRDIDPERRIRVFGRKHLADLTPQIEQWMQSQSGEK